jgi:hypothetical protein
MQMSPFYSSLLLNLLAFYNYVYTTIEKAIVSLRNPSYTPDLYMFGKRNSCPWAVKKGSIYTAIGIQLEFCLDNKLFYSQPNAPESHETLEDFVMGELVDSEGHGVCDMSDFLQNVKWSASSAEERPSLYEMVLVNMLLNNSMIVSKDVMDTYVLNVVTVDDPALSIPMSSSVALRPFQGWSA